jgi:heme exporter protein B
VLSGILGPFLAVLRRDLMLAWRGRADVLVTLAFFIIVVCLFPFGVGAETNQLRAIAPGVLWVAALLSTLLSLHRLFAQDYADGTLEQLLLSPEPTALWVTAKVSAHWIVTGLPLVLAAPGLALLFDVEQGALGVLTLSLALGSPILALLGAVGAALTLGLRGGGVLLALLVLPLFVPVLIFGAGAVDSHLGGTGATAHMLLLGGGLLGALALAPFACAAALRIAIE